MVWRRWTVDDEAEVLLMYGRGVTIEEVARRMLASTQTVTRAIRLNRMTIKQGRYGGFGPPTVALDPDPAGDASRRPGSNGNRLDGHDRTVIQLGLEQGWSVPKIAARIGVVATSIAREIARGANEDGRYWARPAQARADRARARPKASKLDPGELRAAVVARLNDKFSPMQVSHDLRKAFPARDDMRVSHETIYQAIYVQGRGSLRQELKVAKALRSGRTSRIPASKLPPRSTRPWLEGHHISTRPAEVEDRAVPGHWEGDLVIGADHKSALITLAERQSRFTLIRRLALGYDSPTVVEALITMVSFLPRDLRRSLTWDQGSEMSEHARLTIVSNIDVFFCDPHSPWQRGTNENTNGLIRDFYPKGTDFRTIGDDDIERTQHLLNIRPRMTLDWATPAEHLNQLIHHHALTT
ncbi:IS30 family transposase [Agrococcus sp. Ld7]|uniref:IS30 family transposase n=1 Tax=Agrococcus sp. Ld7 TaxID=649148 RepID=UPI00386B4CCA